ncbi:hypothetical protein HLB00_02055, partial [Ferroplasma acidiphilum]|nr:hypothetical protein [Ferroplasma acidiphilum]
MKNKSLILFMVGIIIILNGYELYSKFGYLFYPESYNYLASASTARLYTSLD